MEIFLIGIISYLMGSIPFGFMLTKIFLKKDIREIGSGNIGATNALRTGNKAIGYSTLILDILKAIAPVIFVKIFYIFSSSNFAMSSLTGNIDNLFPFFTTNNSSSLNKIFNSGKLKIFFDLNSYFTFTQSHLGLSGFDFGSKYFESLSN